MYVYMFMQIELVVDEEILILWLQYSVSLQ